MDLDPPQRLEDGPQGRSLVLADLTGEHRTTSEPLPCPARDSIQDLATDRTGHECGPGFATDVGRKRVPLRLRDVGRIGHHQVHPSGQPLGQGDEQIPEVELDLHPERICVGASEVECLGRQVRGVDLGFGEPPGASDGECAGAGTEVDDHFGIRHRVRRQFEQALGLGAGHQHSGVDHDVEIGEGGGALEVLERFAAETANGQGFEIRAAQSTQTALLVGRQTGKGAGHTEMVPDSPAMARILIADDSPTVRLLLRRHLEADGHEIIEAGDGTTAYETGRTGQIDLAILDHLMPGMLGLDVLHRWRSEESTFPVLLLSAVDDDTTVVRSLELGAFDYVRKPFSVPELKARVAARLPA